MYELRDLEDPVFEDAEGVGNREHDGSNLLVHQTVEGSEVDGAVLIAHVKQRLAAYKAPKRVVVVSSIGRAANGKLDYKKLRSDAIDAPAV